MDCNNLKSGQKVCVEVDTNKTPDADLYYIKKGDTCEKLADKFGTTIKVLQNINNCMLFYIYNTFISNIYIYF